MKNLHRTLSRLHLSPNKFEIIPSCNLEQLPKTLHLRFFLTVQTTASSFNSLFLIYKQSFHQVYAEISTDLLPAPSRRRNISTETSSQRGEIENVSDKCLALTPLFIFPQKMWNNPIKSSSHLAINLNAAD